MIDPLQFLNHPNPKVLLSNLYQWYPVACGRFLCFAKEMALFPEADHGCNMKNDEGKTMENTRKHNLQ